MVFLVFGQQSGRAEVAGNPRKPSETPGNPSETLPETPGNPSRFRRQHLQKHLEQRHARARYPLVVTGLALEIYFSFQV